jgi:hypothetical protein
VLGKGGGVVATFRCLIRGENFPGELAGRSGLFGFYVTRFVEAASPADAESRALEALHTEPKLAPPAGYEPSGIARVCFEEIVELHPEQVPAQQPGFVWHPMDSDG